MDWQVSSKVTALLELFVFLSVVCLTPTLLRLEDILFSPLESTEPDQQGRKSKKSLVAGSSKVLILAAFMS
jgi:hypothetical protein